MNKFDIYRKKYLEFIYDKYELIEDEKSLIINYYYEILDLERFIHKIVIPKKIIKSEIDYNFLNNIIFNLGIVEAISYYKCVCPSEFIINCGYINDEQIKWFKKLYYNGLGEFIYRNNIEVSKEDFFDFKINSNKNYSKSSFESSGNLIAIGGGKDSCVSLEILKNEKNNSCFLINSKKTMIDCCKVSGYDDENIYEVERILDKEKLISLNNAGFLNGHIPLNASIAFISYLTAYLTKKRYIILSNEKSANESYVKNKNINHQYSKSYEFEKDFYYYSTKYFSNDIIYFSLLRPLSEIQIAKIFSKLEKYHNIFKSCNLGSKTQEWTWCLNCSKCLFSYIILRTFLSDEKVLKIYGENLLDKESLLNDFIGLIGKGDNKPFECVGTYDEVLYCVKKIIKDCLNKNIKLPYLLNYYYEKYGVDDINDELLNEYNNENNLNEHFEKLLKEILYE